MGLCLSLVVVAVGVWILPSWFDFRFRRLFGPGVVAVVLILVAVVVGFVFICIWFCRVFRVTCCYSFFFISAVAVIVVAVFIINFVWIVVVVCGNIACCC